MLKIYSQTNTLKKKCISSEFYIQYKGKNTLGDWTVSWTTQNKTNHQHSVYIKIILKKIFFAFDSYVQDFYKIKSNKIIYTIW